MRLHLVPGTDGEWSERHTITPASLQLPADPVFGDITVTIQTRQTDRQIRMDIQAETVVSTDCYHCGEPYSFPLVAELTLRAMRVPDPDRDSGDDAMKFIGLAETEIELEQDLRDMLMLALPMRLVCCEEP